MSIALQSLNEAEVAGILQRIEEVSLEDEVPFSATVAPPSTIRSTRRRAAQRAPIVDTEISDDDGSNETDEVSTLQGSEAERQSEIMIDTVHDSARAPTCSVQCLTYLEQTVS